VARRSIATDAEECYTVPMEQDVLSRPVMQIELAVSWAEFGALTSAPDDRTGAALLGAARAFLTGTEVDELLRYHASRAEIHIAAYREVPQPRLRAMLT
jgi:hypothetical protein